MPTFEIGQLIFVVSDKNLTILPGLIQEETRSRSLNGEIVSYKVLVGPPGSPKARVFDLSRVNGEVYGSLEEVKETISKRFMDHIDILCSKAQQNANEWYGGINPNSMQAGPNDKVDPAAIMNDLNNSNPQYVQIQGNQAIPISPGNMNGMMPAANYQQMRRQVQQGMTDSGNPSQLIDMGDGTLKQISINVNNPKE